MDIHNIPRWRRVVRQPVWFVRGWGGFIVLCGVMMLVTGCAASGTGKAAPRTTTTSVRSRLYQMPGPGESMLAADVPTLDRSDPVGRQWNDAGIACRAYDARHGTTSHLSARFADTDYQTTMLADTPCLNHMPMTIRWPRTERSAPDRLEPIAAADVPNLRSRDVRNREWLDGGRTCRAYDRAHGTTTILVFVPSSDSDGEALVADTPCLDAPKGPVDGRARLSVRPTGVGFAPQPRMPGPHRSEVL